MPHNKGEEVGQRTCKDCRYYEGEEGCRLWQESCNAYACKDESADDRPACVEFVPIDVA